MVAIKNRKLNLPEDIENVEINMMQFKTAESRIAYLRLIKKVTIKFFFSDDEEINSLKNHYVSVIGKNVEEFDEYLKKEREEYKPLGYKYDEEVIELELDLYDTIEEQIEYLKNKLIEFDIDTINVTSNKYDDIRNDLKIKIKNREHLIELNKLKAEKHRDEEDLFKEMWEKLVEEFFKPDTFREQLEKIGDKKEDGYIEYCLRRFRHRTIKEWIKYYELADKESQYQSLGKANLTPELDAINRMRTTNARFEESNLGKYTLENLKLFESKYINTKKIDENPVFNFDFDAIKKYAGRLEETKALLYLKHILKEFDREKRENYYLFMSDGEIKYFKENIIITDPAKIYDPPDSILMGIGAKRDLAKKNFEINVKNEIEFLQDKKNLSSKEINEININDPQEFEKMLDTYFEYGKECYLATWKDKFQLLTFEKKMIERYGLKVKGYIVHLYKYIAKKTNPIEFIGCDYDKQRKYLDKEKINNEIKRIDGYLTEIEKLADLTDDDNGINNIPEDELEKYEEWQCYYIEKINDKTLAEWINILRINRPGVWDYKYGEHYQIDFKAVTEFALKEFKNYRDRLENILAVQKGNTIDQDTLIDKFKIECEQRNLQKGKTIPSDTLYELAKAIGFNVPKIEDFRAGEKYYQEAREFASRLGYKRKRRMEP